MVEQQVKLPPVTLASHFRALIQVPAALLPVQLPASVSGKATQDDSSSSSLTHVGELDAVLALGLAWP